MRHDRPIRPATALVLLIALAQPASATCPPDCVAGGGPAATDCFVAWGGIPSMKTSCVDGTPCDLDGQINGTCTFELHGCINATIAGSPCTPGTLDAPPTVKPLASPVGQTLAASLADLELASSACAEQEIVVPLEVGLAGLKRGSARLTITAASGGKRDKDRLRLDCEPNLTPPSFANQVLPIFTAKCTFAGCHDSAFRGGGQSLEPDEAYSSSVNVRSVGAPKLFRVMPGNVKKSFLARKLLGLGIPEFGGALMPLGCPALIDPVTECLTDTEIVTILYWIANGAPNN